jgi:putative spermidine/putrescine transport system permease protein
MGIGQVRLSGSIWPRGGHLADDILQGAVLLVVAIAVAFLLLPLAVTVLMAFDARSYLGPMPPPEFSLRWFERLVGESYFLQGLRTSLYVVIVTVPLSVAVGVASAFVLDQDRFRVKAALTAFMLSPLVVPPVVIGFSLLLFLSSLGVFEGYLRLLAGHLIITVPYTIRATLASLAGIDRSLREAALNLGADERQAFWDVTFPLARTGIVSGAVFAFAVSMDDVAVSLFLTDADTYTLPVALVSSMRANFELTIAAAASLMLAFTALVVFVLDRLVGLDRVVGQGIYRS